MTKTINIALTHNDAYTEHSVVLMTSVILNKKDDEEIIFHIIDGGLSAQSREKLLAVRDCSVNFVPFDNKMFEGYKKSDYYPVQILYTMVLPDILPDVEHLIYLDCDMVVHSSLSELTELDLTGMYLAAVEDANGVKYAKRYGLGEEKFFNTGLMIINCPLWRKDGISAKAAKQAIENTGTSRGYDQTVLNILAKGKVKFLNLKWNLQYCPINVWAYYDDVEQYKAAIKNPNIIHYVGDYKPWVQGLGCFNPKREDYFKYHSETSFAKKDLKGWLKKDKALCYKGLLAFIKRYPFFFLKKRFWRNFFK